MFLLLLGFGFSDTIYLKTFFPALAFLCCFSEDTKDPFPFLTGPQHLVCHLQSGFCFKIHHRKRLSAPSVRACPVLLPFEIVSLHSKARHELVSFLRQGLQVCAPTPARVTGMCPHASEGYRYVPRPARVTGMCPGLQGPVYCRVCLLESLYKLCNGEATSSGFTGSSGPFL